MKDTTLVIMAAGIGSRFGNGIKQLAPVGPSGEIIMDYSIYDAIKAGFNKVVFIIRRDIEQEFREVIGNRMEKLIKVEYVFQELEDIPKGYKVPKGRTKPWGTGQAILNCKEVIKEPFAVINADDYYGKEAFVKVHDYLAKEYECKDKFNFCMAGFILGNTLSDNGAVTRGICRINDDNVLLGVDETSGIEKRENEVFKVMNGKIEKALDKNSYVSMNMWGFTSDFFETLEEEFKVFLDNINNNPLKAEYLIPIIIDNLIKQNRVKVTLLESKDKWFGVTYQEDRISVMNSFRELIKKGVYPEKLYNE